MSRALKPGQSADLYLYDLRSGQARLRYHSADLLFEAPNWSPDGSSLVVNGNGRLWRLDADAGDLREVPLGGVEDINNDHVLSPDGATVYVSSEDGHIHAVALAGGSASRRVSSPKGDRFRHYLHGISPDGSTLAYIGLESRPDGTVRTNVYLLDIESREERQLTDDAFPDDGAEFSPDGEWVYFNSERGSRVPGHAQLFRVPVAGGVPEQLTDDERVNWFPHPSPDGRRLAYVSFPPGTLGHPEDRDVIVRLREEDGSVRDLMKLFGGQGTMNVPSWSPDGASLAFVAYPIS
jgi:Tol biopolymer transport system component